MLADVVVPANHKDADAGFIIMERMGYPVMSSTNTMSTAIALLETGNLPVEGGTNHITLETPGGLMKVRAECSRGKVRSVGYWAQTPSFLLAAGMEVEVPGFGSVCYDIASTGAFYPLIDADSVGIGFARSDEAEIVRFSRAFLNALQPVYRPIHPAFGDEGDLAFVLLTRPLIRTSDGTFTRNLCCYEYPQNSVCRSPACVPSTAIAIQAFEQGRVKVGDVIRTASIFSSDLHVEICEEIPYHGHAAVRVEVAGTGWITMRAKLQIDFGDPTTPGDGLRSLMGVQR